MYKNRLTTKEIILKVASDLFMDKGFQATSTREIAESSGITQPNLYHHFKTKEDIYIAVLEDLSAEVRVVLEDLVAAHNDSLFDSLVEILNYLRDSHPVNFSMMSHDMTHKISEKNHYYLYKVWQDSYVEPLVTLFDRYMDENTPFQSKELTQYFYAIISPFIQREQTLNKQVNSEKIIHLFVYGILDK